MENNKTYWSIKIILGNKIYHRVSQEVINIPDMKKMLIFILLIVSRSTSEKIYYYMRVKS